jgi:hypothetical protein
MTDDQINAAIAEACGWKHHADGRHYYNGKHLLWRTGKDLPNYCTDLNAMHEAEKVMTDEQCVFVRMHLRERLENNPASRYVWNATARQRAEAFLRTLGKWEEGAGVSLIERLMEGCVYRTGDREEMSRVHEDRTDELIFDATERIMKLEAALERILDLPWGESGDIIAARKIAREALE